MSKTIKFNLISNEKPVRDLEDLRNNFSIEDVLELFNNGLLKRWLSVRGYDELLAEIEKIKEKNNTEIIKHLIRIFEVEIDARKIEEGVAILGYIEERKNQLERFSKLDFEAKSVINDYHSGYDSLIVDILDNKDNMPRIKANIKEIENNYLGLFILNYEDLYNELIVNAPLAVFAILMNSKMRDYYIANDYPNEKTIRIYKYLKKFVSNTSELKEKLGEELKVFKGNTEAYWKDIEPNDKTFMIINMQSGNFLRNAGKFGEELTYMDINEKFLIFEGIDYKSNNPTHELLYMEV